MFKDSLNLMTLNVRYDNLYDGIHLWKNRLPVLKKFFKKNTIDLFATQEGRKPQLYELNHIISSYRIADTHRTWIEERMYPSLFYDGDRYTVKKSGDIWLSETPHKPGSSSFQSQFPRLASWMIFQVTDDRMLLIVTCHLDHLHEKTREQQAGVLVSEIKKINTENLPIILMGDFNSSPHSNLYRALLHHLNLKDPWTLMNKKEESSYHKFLGIYEAGTRIDWILIDRNISCKTIEIDKFHRDHIYPSDHFPVKISIEF